MEANPGARSNKWGGKKPRGALLIRWGNSHGAGTAANLRRFSPKEARFSLAKEVLERGASAIQGLKLESTLPPDGKEKLEKIGFPRKSTGVQGKKSRRGDGNQKPCCSNRRQKRESMVPGAAGGWDQYCSTVAGAGESARSSKDLKSCNS